MAKWLIPILFICIGMTGCKKTDSELNRYKAQAAIDDKIVADYIAANNLTDKAFRVTDTSGVYFIILKKGTGSDLFTSSTQVTVGDTGRLLTTQAVFTKTNDFHPSYILSQVILGWRLGIPKANKGGIVRLLIPSRYAYGKYEQKQLNLPANAILDFNIQLYDVTN